MQTIVEPTGVEARIEVNIPIEAQATDMIAEEITTALKLLNMRMDDSAGNMTRAEISREPTRFMARTIMEAVMTAINKLYRSTLIPVAFVNTSSKVTAKILW